MRSCAKMIAICLYLAFSANAEWAPDPTCPWPGYDPVKYPYPGDCTKYWECFDGTKTEQSCPDGLQFNASLQQCDIPEIAKCDPDSNDTPRSRLTKSTTPSLTQDPMCPYPSEDQIYLPYHGDCTKYWTCFEGHKYLHNCPAGLYWHEVISECDYPENVPDCGQGVTTIPSSGSSSTFTALKLKTKRSSTTKNAGFTPDPLCPYPSDRSTYFPVPEDCSKYYECYAGVKTEMSCPPGLYWNHPKRRCGYPGQVVCENDPKKTTSSSSKSTASESTTKSSSTTKNAGFTPDPLCPYPSDRSTYFPVPEDCSKYYECYAGVKTEMSCPPGLYWNHPKRRCGYPGQVVCENDPKKTTSSSSKSTASESTTKSSSTTKNAGFTPDPLCPYPSDRSTYFPVPEDCSKYYECYAGAKTEMSCPPGLYWNHPKRRCGYPGQVVCENDPKKTTSSSSKSTASESTTKSSSTTKNAGFTPDPLCPYPSDRSTYFPVLEDCSKYYECYAGVKTEMSCPPGLYWNHPKRRCGYPGQVVCENN